MKEKPSRSGVAGTHIRKVAGACLVGTTIEFYDFFIYGTAAALVFPKVFFPETTPFIGSLLSFGSFGAGFVARPLGGALFGHFGDRVGRKKMLIASMVMMGLATVAVGLLPTYAVAGPIAPVLLVLLRLVQGIAVGGEWGGAVLMAVEHAPPDKRGYYGSWAQAGTSLGTVLATGVFLAASLTPADQFLAVGWRIPYICIVYLVAYGTTTVGASRTSVLTVVMMSAAVSTVLVLVFGALSDRWGRKPLYLCGALGMGVLIFPAFALFGTGSFVLMLVAHTMVLGVALSVAAGPTAAMFAEMFSTRLRYTGASVGYQLAGVFGAALSPIIAASLLESVGSAYAIAGYVALMAVISLIAVALMPESRGTEIVKVESAKPASAPHESRHPLGAASSEFAKHSASARKEEV